MTEFLLSCARLWPPSESDLGKGAQREQQPQLRLFVKLKCLSKANFFTSILNLWRISYFLRFFNWLHGSCKPCADVSVGGRLRATRWTWVLAWPYGTCEKTNKLPANRLQQPTQLNWRYTPLHVQCACASMSKNSQECTDVISHAEGIHTAPLHAHAICTTTCGPPCSKSYFRLSLFKSGNWKLITLFESWTLFSADRVCLEEVFIEPVTCGNRARAGGMPGEAMGCNILLLWVVCNL